ncbi:MAG: hypothetical protein ACK4WF_05920, partial [Candidatus Brocadiales bacterium]
DFQFHTTLSDGRASLWEMAQAARAAGLKYALVSDHSRGLGVAHGAGPEELRRQRAEIEEVNRRMGGAFRVLAGVEVEVRADGSLDLPDEVLAELDLVVAAVHSGLRQPREQFTARAVAALRHPHVDILAHPTRGLRKASIAVPSHYYNIIIEKAFSRGIALEVNAHSLDPNSIFLRRCLEKGAKLAFNTDSHSLKEFGDFSFHKLMLKEAGVNGKEPLENCFQLE